MALDCIAFLFRQRVCEESAELSGGQVVHEYHLA
jgi:hypothetical protein